MAFINNTELIYVTEVLCDVESVKAIVIENIIEVELWLSFPEISEEWIIEGEMVISKPILSLQQFILKQEVKSLYREIFKAIRKVPGRSHQNELREWARRDFRANANTQDELTIRMHINYGKRCLKELQNSLALSG